MSSTAILELTRLLLSCPAPDPEDFVGFSARIPSELFMREASRIEICLYTKQSNDIISVATSHLVNFQHKTTNTLPNKDMPRNDIPSSTIPYL